MPAAKETAAERRRRIAQELADLESEESASQGQSSLPADALQPAETVTTERRVTHVQAPIYPRGHQWPGKA